jgi:putative thioredoxin
LAFDIKDFEKDVIERSSKTPVVVDFWAEWCDPCKVLGPILEKLASQASRRWALAKVNTEELTDVAIQYGVQSIPNVKMFIDGKVASEFIGALPEQTIVQWLEKNLPDPDENILDEAERLTRSGKTQDALKIIENILKKNAMHARARIMLASFILFSDPAKARSLLNGLEEPAYSEQIDSIQTLSRIIGLAKDPSPLPVADVRKEYVEAALAVSAQRFDAALGHFVNVIRSNRYYDDDGSRKACIAIFKYLGEEHPVTQEYRREFSRALY